MTAVLFKFSNPDGTPVADAPFLITTRKASFDETLHNGIQVPGDINAVTDAQGEATVTLLAGFATYYLLMDRSGAEADSTGCTSGLRYRFVVTESDTPLRVEDLIISTPTWSRPWDETALQVIIDAKAVSQASAVAAKASEDAASDSAALAEAAVAGTLTNAQAAAASAATATGAATTATTASTAAVQARDVAQGYRDQAGTSASAAAASATAADASKVAAAGSATAALASQTSATGSATTATTQAGIATTKATESAASAASALADKNTTLAARDVTLGYRDQAEDARDEALAAASVFSGGLVEGGDIDLSGGAYPSAPVYSTLWRVSVAGTVSGTAYAVGDNLVYSKTLSAFYKGDNTDAVTSVAGKIGAVTLVKADVGLSAVDNTSDVNKPVSTAQATSIATKQAGHANLTALSTVAAAADRVPIFTGTTTASHLVAGATGKTVLAAATQVAAQDALGATTVGKAVLTAASDAAARTALSLGTVATFPVTTSTTDSTQGRILKVGDHGIGGVTVPTLLGTEVDSLTTSGMYYALGGGSNQGSLPFNTNGYLLSTVYSTTYAMQMWTQVITNITWTRGSNNGVWGPWSKVMTHNTMIGTVSQAGDLPSGAIIERGTTANGEYTKYADGTIQCWGLVSDLAHTANTELVSIWTLPTACLYITVLTGIQMTVRAPSATQNFGVTKMQASLVSATSVQFRTVFTTAQNYSIFLSLQGRWF